MGKERHEERATSACIKSQRSAALNRTDNSTVMSYPCDISIFHFCCHICEIIAMFVSATLRSHFLCVFTFCMAFSFSSSPSSFFLFSFSVSSSCLFHSPTLFHLCSTVFLPCNETGSVEDDKNEVS